MGGRRGIWDVSLILEVKGVDVRELFSRFLGCKPADIYDFVVFVEIADWHRHVVIGRYNLLSVSTSHASPGYEDSLLGNRH